MLFLKEFWYGNITPGGERYHDQKEYSKHWKVMEQCENELKEQLSPEAWALFSKYQDAEREVSSVAETDIFIDGFRLGAKVILDVLLKTA